MNLKAQQCRDSIADWYFCQEHLPPTKRKAAPALLTRVADTLRRDIAGQVPDAEWIDLADAIKDAKAAPTADVEPPTYPLDEESAKIIRALRAVHPELLTAPNISTDADIALVTAKARVRKLIEAGFVHRPLGENSGAGLTDAGLTLAEQLPPPKERNSEVRRK